MNGWAGVALALRTAGDDGLASRLPTYLHPLAGRILAWHVLRAMADLRPRPRQLFLASGSPLDPTITGDLPAEVVTVAGGESDGSDAAADATNGARAWSVLAERLEPADVGRLLFVDAAAAALSGSLARLVSGPAGRVLRDGSDRVIAAWLDAEDAAERAAAGGLSLDGIGRDLPMLRQGDDGERFIVRDRATLARASRIVRDRLIADLMAGGVTFLVPESVVVDVDVAIEPDTVIYPGAVLEGQTTIGAETVIGPGCRIIDSRIGSGVELKGWNYVVGTSIRNRAVLEPYVRRGHD